MYCLLQIDILFVEFDLNLFNTKHELVTLIDHYNGAKEVGKTLHNLSVIMAY